MKNNLNLKKPILRNRNGEYKFKEINFCNEDFNLFNINIKGKILLQSDGRFLRLDNLKNPYILIETLDKEIILSYPKQNFIDYLNKNKDLIYQENIFRGQLLTVQDIYNNNINRLIFNKLIGIDNESEETKEFKLICNCFKVFDNITENYNQNNFLLVKISKFDENINDYRKITLKLSYDKLNVPVNNNNHPDLISTYNKITIERVKSTLKIKYIELLNY